MTRSDGHRSSTLKVRAEPIQQRSAERVTLLLDTAADLIAARGIDALTTSSVATRSGSSVGVVYRYFPNVQSLLRALARRNLERHLDSVRTTFPESSATDALVAAVDSYANLMRTEPGFRALRFGDVIDERFVDADESNASLLVQEYSDLLARHHSVEASAGFALDLEIAVITSNALADRAFQFNSEGDERFLDAAKRAIVAALSPANA